MKNPLAIFLSGLLLLLAIGVGVFFFSQKQTPEQEAPVAATIFPVYDLTQQIAGDAIDVALLLPAGASPHTYEPTPSQIRSLENVELVFAIGHGVDTWSDTLIDATGAQKVTLDSGIELREAEEDHHEDEEEEDEHDHDHEHEHGDIDPHYWLTVNNAKIMAWTIADTLSTQFPEHRTIFQQNYQTLVSDLTRTEQEMVALMNEVKNPNIITLHDGWYYFADAYGLNVVGTYEPTAGREPSPQYLIELTEALHTSGSSVLYSEPQLSTQNLSSFLQDNNLTVAELDPIGGTTGRLTYIDLMLYNGRVVSENQ